MGLGNTPKPSLQMIQNIITHVFPSLVLSPAGRMDTFNPVNKCASEKLGLHPSPPASMWESQSLNPDLT